MCVLYICTYITFIEYIHTYVKTHICVNANVHVHIVCVQKVMRCLHKHMHAYVYKRTFETIHVHSHACAPARCTDLNIIIATSQTPVRIHLSIPTTGRIQPSRAQPGPDSSPNDCPPGLP